MNYVDGFEGINSLVIKKRDAQVIADLMLGGEGNPVDEELNEIHISAVQEAMNQMMGSSATSMSTIFNRFVNISPPGIDILNLESGEGVSNLPADETLIQVSFRLLIGDLIDSNLMQLLPVHFAKSMVDMLIGGAQESTASAPVASTPEPAPAPVPATPPPVAERPPVQHQQAPQAPQQPAQDYNGYGQAPMGMPQGMPPQRPYGMPPAATLWCTSTLRWNAK